MIDGWEAPLWYDRLAGIAWRGIAIVVALAIFVALLIGLSVIIVPVLLGLLFAAGLNPLVTWLRRRRVPGSVAALMATLLLVGALVFVVWLTVEAVIDQWDEIEALIDEGQVALVGAATDNGVDPNTAAEAQSDVSGLVGAVTDALLGGLLRLVPTVAGIIASIVLSLFVAFFFLKDGPAMWRWLVERVGETRPLAERIGTGVWKALSGFILGQTAIAAIDATLIGLGALLLGVPEPMAIFMLTLFGAYIPYIGAFLSGMVAVLLALGDSGVSGGLAMLAVVLGVQVFEGNVLQPWIQGKAVRLHPLVIALAVTAGGAIAGFLGVLLAVPLTAAGFAMLVELRAAGIVGPRPEADTV